MSREFLVDGYNLIYALGLLNLQGGKDRLQRARLRLLDFFLDALGPEAAHVTVVFDAAAAPPGASHFENFRGVSVRYAREGGQADDLIEDLIDACQTPSRLVVISNDHRLQRHARKHAALAWSSSDLLDFVEARGRTPPRPQAEKGEKEGLDSDAERAHWSQVFRKLDTDPAFKELFQPFDFDEPS